MLLPLINKSILTLLIFFPLFGAFVLALLPHTKKNLVGKITLAIFVLEFLFALHLPFHFSNTGVTDQFFVELPWIPDWNIFYRLGIDGLSLVLIVLTILVVGLSMWKENRGEGIVLLILTACLVGSFCALDLFLFSVFFQLSLFLISFLTLHASRFTCLPAGRRFTILIPDPSPLFPVLTLLSSTTILTAVLMLAWRCDQSFNLFQLMNYRLPLSEQRILAGLFVFGLLVPLPFLRFDKTHPQAIFVPVLGLYGLLRFVFPLLPNALQKLQSFPVIMTLAIAAIALLMIALVQKISFARRTVTLAVICGLVIVLSLTAKPVWTLVERSSETVLLYMQSERTVVLTEGVKQP